MPYRRWILVRHPDKEGDAEGIYVGNAARVTEKGWGQIELMAKRLDDMHPDVVLSSELPRAVDLGSALAGRMKHAMLKKNVLLNEIDKPQFLSGLSRKDPRHVRFMQAVREGFDDDRVPDLAFVREIWEGYDDRPVPGPFSMMSRSDLERQTADLFAYVEECLSTYHTVLSVTHAKRIAACVHWVYRGGTLKEFYRQADHTLKFATTGVTILTREPDRHTGKVHWHIERINDTSHEERASTKEMQTLLAKLL